MQRPSWGGHLTFFGMKLLKWKSWKLVPPLTSHRGVTETVWSVSYPAKGVYIPVGIPSCPGGAASQSHRWSSEPLWPPGWGSMPPRSSKSFLVTTSPSKVNTHTYCLFIQRTLPLSLPFLSVSSSHNTQWLKPTVTLYYKLQQLRLPPPGAGNRSFSKFKEVKQLFSRLLPSSSPVKGEINFVQ